MNIDFSFLWNSGQDREDNDEPMEHLAPPDNAMSTDQVVFTDDDDDDDENAAPNQGFGDQALEEAISAAGGLNADDGNQHYDEDEILQVLEDLEKMEGLGKSEEEAKEEEEEAVMDADAFVPQASRDPMPPPLLLQLKTGGGVQKRSVLCQPKPVVKILPRPPPQVDYAIVAEPPPPSPAPVPVPLEHLEEMLHQLPPVVVVPPVVAVPVPIVVEGRTFQEAMNDYRGVQIQHQGVYAAVFASHQMDLESLVANHKKQLDEINVTYEQQTAEAKQEVNAIVEASLKIVSFLVFNSSWGET
jgi:hypothetical protein